MPAEGVGLNPLLRHPSMMIHPPMLYSGYTLFAIPFAFAVGALVTRRLDAEWIRSTRPFTLAAWCCLGFGIVLGARWSYSELGWGGYWAWDPVENASLMPWLTGTAFLHSVMIQERRGMLKVWNVSLVLATGVLAILGTFLVRSGILKSIHAFGASTLGVPFLLLIGAMIARLDRARRRARRATLRSEHRLDSLLSREAVFLLNNLVLVALCFVVFWGTFFPLISEAVTGNQASVGPPWFDRYIVPLALVLVLLSGIGPRDRVAARDAGATCAATFAVPAASALGACSCSLLAAGVTERVDRAADVRAARRSCSAASARSTWRGVRARRAMAREPVPLALVSLVRRNRRRYGGYLVHVGVAVLFVGVAASSAFQHVARRRAAARARRAKVGGYTLTYVQARPAGSSPPPTGGSSGSTSAPTCACARDGTAAGTLHTHRSYFPTDGSDARPGRRASSRARRRARSACAPACGATSGAAISPDLVDLRRAIDQGDKVFRDAGGSLSPPAQRDRARDRRCAGLHAIATPQHPPPATFRLLVSPLVTLDLARRADRLPRPGRSRSGPRRGPRRRRRAPPGRRRGSGARRASPAGV